MIFVTVGTHEQQFDRLVKKIDQLKKNRIIKENVIIQTGYSEYKPKFCEGYDFLSCDEMEKYVSEARIVITHGGPSSFMMALQKGKIPIVVPRQKEWGEHVNDHQVKFTTAVKKRDGNIIVVLDIEKLQKVIQNYDSIAEKIKVHITSNNENFNRQLEEIVKNIMGES